MIEVMLQTECPDGTERIIKRAAEGALKQQKAGGDISVLVTDDDTIWKMNREYRNVDRATDVLSFPSCDGDAIAAAPGGFLGDIAISIHKAKAQAEEYGHSFERELSFLTVHGCLHLLGYDHLDEGPQKRQMRAREEAIASEIPGMSRK